MKKTTVLALLLVSGFVHAQSAPAATSATKKDLIARILLAQQPAIEQTAQTMVEGPAMSLWQQAAMALQTQVPPEKRDAAAKLVKDDLKKFVDDVVPSIRQQAVKTAPSTIGALLDEKFTEDELKQLAGYLESPITRRFNQMGPEFQKVLSEKLVAATQASVEPKVKALQQAIVAHLGPPAAPASAPGSKAPAASGAKPVKK